MANFYEGTFQDSEGKKFTARANCVDDTKAKEYFNALAAKSGAKWTRLRKIADVTIVGPPANWLSAAQAGSTVQVRGRCTYRTGIPRNFITVEIPAVKSTVVSAGSRSSTTDPLTAPTRAMLKTENNTAASAIKAVHYLERIRA